MAELVDASEYNNCADVTADAVSYYLYRFESCQDYFFNHLNTQAMNEETETAVEFLFRMYMDNKQKLTLADFINAYDIETELLIQASEQNYQSEN